MKKWEIERSEHGGADIIPILLKNRGLTTQKEINNFLHPPNPQFLTPEDVDINDEHLALAISRIKKAIDGGESIVVYADYDADGICAGAIMWEALHRMGAKVMPYIPHRTEEGYGLSIKGIDAVKKQFNPSLIITVDHGITAKAKVAYAKKLGIDTVVTDHHLAPDELPDCPVVHTTKLCGAGIAWFVAKELSGKEADNQPLLELAAIGTIADLVPLIGPNRSIVKYGLEAIRHTKRVGLEALMHDAGLTKSEIGTYDVSHMIAPRLNAMGRLEHALDSLRLLCTGQKDKAANLAEKLGLTNRERQQLTAETALHAIETLSGVVDKKKLLFIGHETYNPGVIGLVAGKLVEEYYRPAIVVSLGQIYSKASARSVAGFNIVDAIRQCSDILVDVGGHPMAAGFTVETAHLFALQTRLEEIAEALLTDDILTRTLRVDAEISFNLITDELVHALDDFAPTGFGNPDPVFATQNVTVVEFRLVGSDGKHLKLQLKDSSGSRPMEAIAFGMGSLAGEIPRPDRGGQNAKSVDIAYTIAVDNWNGNRRLQLKIKDIHLR